MGEGDVREGFGFGLRPLAPGEVSLGTGEDEEGRPLGREEARAVFGDADVVAAEADDGVGFPERGGEAVVVPEGLREFDHLVGHGGRLGWVEGEINAGLVV